MVVLTLYVAIFCHSPLVWWFLHCMLQYSVTLHLCGGSYIVCCNTLSLSSCVVVLRLYVAIFCHSPLVWWFLHCMLQYSVTRVVVLTLYVAIFCHSPLVWWFLHCMLQSSVTLHLCGGSYIVCCNLLSLSTCVVVLTLYVAIFSRSPIVWWFFLTQRFLALPVCSLGGPEPPPRSQTSMLLGTGGLGIFVHCMLVFMAYPSTLANTGWKEVPKLEYQG